MIIISTFSLRLQSVSALACSASFIFSERFPVLAAWPILDSSLDISWRFFEACTIDLTETPNVWRRCLADPRLVSSRGSSIKDLFSEHQFMTLSWSSKNLSQASMALPTWELSHENLGLTCKYFFGVCEDERLFLWVLIICLILKYYKLPLLCFQFMLYFKNPLLRFAVTIFRPRADVLFSILHTLFFSHRWALLSYR